MEDRNIDRIERYLQDEMEEAERRTFESELKKDDELQRQLSAYLLAVDAIEGEIRSDLKDKMEKWEAPGRKGNGRSGMWSGILIAVFALAAITVFWMCPAEEEEQWSQYAAVNIETLQRSAGPSDEIRLLNQYYVSGNYAKAQQMINSMGAGKQEQAEVQFIQGLLNYQKEDFENAVSIFALLKGSDQAHFSIVEQSEYYYLLSLIRMGNCGEDCRQSLENIAEESEHLRQKEANKLLNEVSF